MAETLKAPFPWFGGKSRCADLVWERFGPIQNYVEPFFGSGAVLLANPAPCIETVNDMDTYLANFWRALQSDPDAVASHADWPVNEADLTARHQWLVNQGEFRERMKTDPDYFDPKIAGWWVWGQSAWIGGGWCEVRGTGVHRKRPHLRTAGMGVHRKLPRLNEAGAGIHAPTRRHIYAYMRALAARLRDVRVCCGDWSRVLGETPTLCNGLTGVFLDPPYSADANRTKTIYAVEDLSVAHEAAKWAIQNGDNSELRIALCGYEGEHDMPPSWECVSWKTKGGYALISDNSQGLLNMYRERIWFSPACLKADLFSF
jgi:site-specific DNA-adenine methylase